VHAGRRRLDAALNQMVERAADDCDVACLLAEPSGGWPADLEALRVRLAARGKPTLLVATQIDRPASAAAAWPPPAIDPSAIALAQGALGSSTPGGPPPRDPTTAFLEWAHARRQQTPSYRPSEDSGIADDDARFTVEVRIGDECWGRGTGRTKRAAEREAALRALEGAGRSDG
jgi:hypothetical protein